MRNKRLYNIFWHMIRRTEYLQNKDYRYYGAKGIRICPEWRHNFDLFQEWALENGYADDLTIDRIDNSKGYDPSNCRWVTKAEQNHNKTDLVIIDFGGKSVTFGELSREYGIPCNILYKRVVDYGWSIERATSEPVHSIKRAITFQGKTQSIRQWAKEFNIHHSTLSLRLRKGVPFDIAVGV